MLTGMQPSIMLLTPTMAQKPWIRLSNNYRYLPRRCSLTLSQVAALPIEEFLPDTFQKCLFQNFKQTSFNRVYSDFVPSYDPHRWFTLSRPKSQQSQIPRGWYSLCEWESWGVYSARKKQSPHSWLWNIKWNGIIHRLDLLVTRSCP